MARADDFNDRQTQIDAENEPYSPYVYQTEDNGSWAGALPVKQYAAFSIRYAIGVANMAAGGCMIQT